MTGRRVWAGAGMLAALAIGAAAVRRRHIKLIASDPEQALLLVPPSGRSLRARSADGSDLPVDVSSGDESAMVVLAPAWTEP